MNTNYGYMYKKIYPKSKKIGVIHRKYVLFNRKLWITPHTFTKILNFKEFLMCIIHKVINRNCG